MVRLKMSFIYTCSIFLFQERNICTYITPDRKNKQPDSQSSPEKYQKLPYNLGFCLLQETGVFSSLQGKKKNLMKNLPTFSRSGSLKARASSLLSITDAAATSKGVDPRIEGEAVKITFRFNTNFIKPNKFIGNELPFF